MRVLLADDHTLLLEGLRNLLEAHEIEVVGTARNGCEAVQLAKQLLPDVILMDIRMPVCDGLTATRLIKSELPEMKIIVLTTSADEQDLFEAVKSGAGGYLLKSMDAVSLIEALRDAQQDVPPFAPGLAARLLDEFARSSEDSDESAAEGERAAGASPADGIAPEKDATRLAETHSRTSETPPDEPLSSRQVEVLALVAQGLSYKEVGRRVYLSPRTVKYHMAEIMRKLHLQNRAQVLAYAGLLLSECEDEETA
ncbi:MAG: response regulator transcription factor [Thermoleophilia bacterium]